MIDGVICSGKKYYKQDVFSILATQARLTNGLSILGKIRFYFAFISFLKNSVKFS